MNLIPQYSHFLPFYGRIKADPARRFLILVHRQISRTYKSISFFIRLRSSKSMERAEVTAAA